MLVVHCIKLELVLRIGRIDFVLCRGIFKSVLYRNPGQFSDPPPPRCYHWIVSPKNTVAPIPTGRSNRNSTRVHVRSCSYSCSSHHTTTRTCATFVVHYNAHSSSGATRRFVFVAFSFTSKTGRFCMHPLVRYHPSTVPCRNSCFRFRPSSRFGSVRERVAFRNACREARRQHANSASGCSTGTLVSTKAGCSVRCGDHGSSPAVGCARLVASPRRQQA